MSVSNGWSVAEMNPGLKDQPRPPYHPSQRKPRDAAVLILVDRSGPEPRVLLGKRHEALAFMPGYYVFPGGKVEVYDRRAEAAGALPAHVEARLQKHVSNPSPVRARGYAMAAIRELAEETGLFVGARDERCKSLKGEWQAFCECGIAPVLDDLWFVARSVTPPGLPRRYDTRFFATDVERVCHRIDGMIHPDAELVDLRWVPIRDIEGLEIHRITRIVLSELDQRLKAGLERDLPVPFFRPHRGVLQRHEI